MGPTFGGIERGHLLGLAWFGRTTPRRLGSLGQGPTPVRPEAAHFSHVTERSRTDRIGGFVWSGGEP
jgi:hypothetical protein